VVKLLNKLRKAEDIADIYYTDPESGYSALHAAAKCNQYDATRIILENGCIDVNWPTQNKDKQTPLHLACIE
jgi:ankyrin repeat protein